MTKQQLRTRLQQFYLFGNGAFTDDTLNEMIEFIWPVVGGDLAIGFKVWCDENKYIKNGDYYSNRPAEGGVKTLFTLQELYNIFSPAKTNQQ